MAAASCLVSEAQFLCSVCLDVFTEPVSIPCGHNFCKACINRHWDGKELRQCPLCKEHFNRDLKLCVNTTFRDIVEDYKAQSKESPQDTGQLLVQPGQVPCDCCPGTRASKTCLVCLASYCENHLQSHRTVEALKRHTLTDPVLNLEDKICLKHNRILELFCRDDLTCICVLCTDHSGHDTVPLEKAFVNKRCHTGNKNVPVIARNKRKTKKRAAGHPKRKHDNKQNNVVPYLGWFPSEHPANCSGCSCPVGAFQHKIQVTHLTKWNFVVVAEYVCGKFLGTQIHPNGLTQIFFRDVSRPLQTDTVHMCLIKTPECVLLFSESKCKVESFSDSESGIEVFSLKGSRFIRTLFFCFIPGTTRTNTNMLLNVIQKSKQSDSSHIVFLCVLIFFFIIILHCIANT